MRVERQFTTAGKGPYDGIEFRNATSEIRNPDGSFRPELTGDFARWFATDPHE